MENIITCIDLSAPRKAVCYLVDKVNDKILDYNLLPDYKRERIEKTFNTVDNIFTVVTLLILVSSSVASPTAIPALATVEGALTGGDKIIAACDPIIDLIRGIGYPACSIMMSAGAITMAFNKKKGVQFMKDAGVAYGATQLVPVIMKILRDALKNI